MIFMRVERTQGEDMARIMMGGIQMNRRISRTGAVLLSVIFFVNGAWADPHDPVLPGPKLRGAAEGLGVGSLISSAVLATPPKSDGSGGDVVVWGYRKNGHSGNYNYNGNNVGFEHNSAADRKNFPRFETVKDLKNQSHPLYGQKVIRLFTTAHTFYVLTEEGELWSWGDSLHGTAGCVNTGYETGVDASNRFNDYGIVYNTYYLPGGGTARGSHYQARPCPTFGTRTPTAQIKKKIAYIDGGEYNAIAITDDGEVYTWGSGTFYQTVASSYGVPAGNKGVPVNITRFFEGEQVILVGGAYEGQYAVSVDQKGKYTLWGWGRSFNYALVNTAYDTYVGKPTRLTQYDKYANRIIYVNGGYGWTAVLLDDGRVYGSGLKRHLGQGNGGAPDGQNFFEPQLIMGEGSGYPKATKLIVRYAGGVAVPEGDDKALYTWGWTTGSAYAQVYGDRPTKRELAGKLKSVGANKEAIFYLTEDNALYGVGYGDQRVVNVCDNLTVSWDRQRNRWVNKNSMNWYRNASSPGGYRIPYENLIDVTGVDFCDGTFSSGFYAGKSRQAVRRWTGYDDGRDGPVPQDSGALLCQNSGQC